MAGSSWREEVAPLPSSTNTLWHPSPALLSTPSREHGEHGDLYLPSSSASPTTSTSSPPSLSSLSPPPPSHPARVLEDRVREAEEHLALLLRLRSTVAPLLPSPDLGHQVALHRTAATSLPCTRRWQGDLPPHSPHGPCSSKVFLGWGAHSPSLPTSSLLHHLRHLSPVRVERAGSKGCLYLVLPGPAEVEELVGRSEVEGERALLSLEGLPPLHVVPWRLADSSHFSAASRFTATSHSSHSTTSHSSHSTTANTVFVSAIHGLLTARGLATILQQLFGKVESAALTTDQHSYPMGSARVTFAAAGSFMAAVAAEVIEVSTPAFSKNIQIDPFLVDAPCSVCVCKRGSYFCRQLSCFSYYCRGCWEGQHLARRGHRPTARGGQGRE